MAMAKPRQDIDKAAFISAAEHLITDKGANDFSLADLAKEMGISKGTIYYHYPTKDALIMDIVEWHFDLLSKDYIDWFSRHQDDGISFERFLDVIFYKGVKLFNKAKMHIYLIGECMRGNENLRKQFTTLWKEWQGKLEKGLEKVLPEEADKEAYAYYLMLIIDGLTVQEALSNPDVGLNERMKQIVLKGEKKA
jgi:AcrR family transcriptional regulator